jgi:hypothetical protein
MNAPATRRRWLLAALQVIALLGGVIYLARIARSYGPQLAHVHIAFDWGLLVLASLVWYASFIQLVESWTSSLTWWGWRLRWDDGLRVFFFSNLARYIPGGIWQFAGLAALAVEAGGSAVTASAAVLLLQVVLLATGFVMTLGVAPNALGPWAAALGATSRAVLALVASIALIAVAPRAFPFVRRQLERVLKRSVPLPIPPAWPFALYVARTALAWIGYGISFWLFSRALLGPNVPDVWFSSSAYVASYLAGMIAVFAPGGIVVREAALVIAFRSSLGPERALVLALASRLWLIALEVIGAIILLGVDRLVMGARSARGGPT